MPSLRRFALLFLLLPLLIITGKTFAAPTVTYYSVYLQKSRVGYMTVLSDNHATYKSRAAVLSRSQMHIELSILGTSAKTDSTTVSYSDAKTGAPLYQVSHTDEAGRSSDVAAIYETNSLHYTVDIAGAKSEGILTLKPGEHFLSDAEAAGEIKPRIGSRQSGKVFISENLSLVDGSIEVIAKETVDVGGLSVVAFKVLQKNSIADSTLWINEAGDLLRIDAPLSLHIVKSSKEIALSAPDISADLTAAIAVTPTGIEIALPRTSKNAEYILGNATRDLAPSDSVQQVTYTGSGTERKAVVTITAHPLPTTGAPRFARPDAAPQNLQAYLQKTIYVPARSDEFAAIVRQIVDKGDDTASAAAKIAVYVHKTIKPDPSIPALRTADDVRRDPRGVCRDYTTYFTAIARTAGIPTKQCVGMAFVNGQFLYHAWPEVWVGGDNWVALEPTWGMAFADATHIKLAEGEITDFVKITGDIGSYRVEVRKAN